MSAYFIIRLQSDEPARLKEYQARVPAIVEKYRGRFPARGGQVLSLEGPQEKRRVVLIEFPSLEQAEAFYHSDEYCQAKALREGLAEVEIIAVDGLDG